MARSPAGKDAYRREMHGQGRNDVQKYLRHNDSLVRSAFPRIAKRVTSCVDDVVPTRACRKIQPPVTLQDRGRLLEGLGGLFSSSCDSVKAASQ
jgi:hypothetical protein